MRARSEAASRSGAFRESRNPLHARIGAILGGEKLIGHAIRSDGDLASVATQGLPLESLDAFKRHGFTDREVGTIIHPRTLRHRVARREQLSPEEADRAIRLARIQAKAVETFGSETDGWRWLREPLEMLGDKPPLEIAATDAGARLVETLLAKIAWGAAA